MAPMAQALNMSRIRDTRLIGVVLVLSLLVSQPMIAYGTWGFGAAQFFGHMLVAVCVLGRVYSTAFLGGHKNESLIRQGPFSVVRNPLYVFSYIGILGVSLMSGRVLVLVVNAVLFAVMYSKLVKREEVFLADKFGEDYQLFLQEVPRFIPKRKLYVQPDEIPLRPKYLVNAVKDAFAWFLILPAFELIQHLQTIHVLPVWFSMP
jgi:protein-S-isoprenylcysteine O-methyltransferase Ste14